MMCKSMWPVIGFLLLLPEAPARAHWCTNIYDTPARIVVKPEQSTVFPGMNPGDSTTLRVWVRNNFPYVVTDAEMRATNSDFDVTVTPGRQDIYPEQESAFDFQITRVADSGDDDLHLQIRLYVDNHSGINQWRDESDDWVEQTPSESRLRGGMTSGQAQQLNSAKLAALYSEPDGEGRLLELYGRPRLGYNNQGTWGDGDWFPDRSLTKWDYQILRAGVELAKRWSDDPATRTAMIDAMDDPDELYRGTSALIAAFLGSNPAVRERIETMATTDACVDATLCSHYDWTPSDDARLMAKAALVVLGDNQYHAEVTAGLSSSSERVQMICGAALGLAGEDDPVVNTLRPLARDTDAAALLYLHGAYLLSLVATQRRGPDDTGCVTFYGEVCDDQVPPRAPQNLQVRPAD